MNLTSCTTACRTHQSPQHIVRSVCFCDALASSEDMPPTPFATHWPVAQSTLEWGRWIRIAMSHEVFWRGPLDPDCHLEGGPPDPAHQVAIWRWGRPLPAGSNLVAFQLEIILETHHFGGGRRIRSWSKVAAMIFQDFQDFQDFQVGFSRFSKCSSWIFKIFKIFKFSKNFQV